MVISFPGEASTAFFSLAGAFLDLLLRGLTLRDHVAVPLGGGTGSSTRSCMFNGGIVLCIFQDSVVLYQDKRKSCEECSAVSTFSDVR